MTKMFWIVLFAHLQGQLDLAFPVADEGWFFQRGTEYKFAVYRIAETFHKGAKKS